MALIGTFLTCKKKTQFDNLECRKVQNYFTDIKSHEIFEIFQQECLVPKTLSSLFMKINYQYLTKSVFLL